MVRLSWWYALGKRCIWGDWQTCSSITVASTIPSGSILIQIDRLAIDSDLAVQRSRIRPDRSQVATCTPTMSTKPRLTTPDIENPALWLARTKGRVIITTSFSCDGMFLATGDDQGLLTVCANNYTLYH